MIRMQTGQISNIASDLNSQRTEIMALLERTQTLITQISRQSYTDDALYRLTRLRNRLEEIRDSMGQFAEGLEEVCETVEQTEKKVAGIYGDECPKAVEFTVQNMKVCLNSNLGSIAKITW